MLRIIQVGHDDASDRYIMNKVKRIAKEGMSADVIGFDIETTTQVLIDCIKRVAGESDTKAIMVQLPLPRHIDRAAVMEAIPPHLDIDGLNPKSDYKPLTPCAIMRWLRERGEDMEGKQVVILGRSELVGKPLANMMIEAGATVTICNSLTQPRMKHTFCRMADIIVSAVGKIGIVSYKDLSVWRYQTIIDVGINRNENGKLCGDVDEETKIYVERCGGHVTPVPNGVGKWTVEELVLRLREMEGR